MREIEPEYFMMYRTNTAESWKISMTNGNPTVYNKRAAEEQFNILASAHGCQNVYLLEIVRLKSKTTFTID